MLLPDTPRRVLQSRYSAFCWRRIDYIQHTTHETCRDYTEDKIRWARDLNKDGMFDSFSFQELRILDESEVKEGDEEATVAFEVVLKSRETQEETVVAETSTFRKEGSGWLYSGGAVSSKSLGPDVSLN